MPIVPLEASEIAFETQLGVSGSGTSPTVSFDGSTVYVVDGEGHLTGVSAVDGSVVWQSSERSVMGVSSSTMPDGKVFTFQFNELICWDGSNGDVLWRHDLNWIADEEITRLADALRSAAGGRGVRHHDHGGRRLGSSSRPALRSRFRKISATWRSRRLPGCRSTPSNSPSKHFLVHYDYDGNFVQPGTVRG